MRLSRFVHVVVLLLAALAFTGCPKNGGGGEDTVHVDIPRPPSPAPAGDGLPVWGCTVVKTFPHDPGAFTEGLLWYNGGLFESTGMHNTSSVRKTELATGNVLRRFDLPAQYFGEGLALVDGRLHQLTWQTNVGFVYDLTSFAKVDTFTYYGEGWGLTTDGAELIMSDGTSFLRFMDPATHAVKRTVGVTAAGKPVEDINELEWVKGEIYANIWKTEKIARIDPVNGNVLGWIDCKGILPASDRSGHEDVMNGIAYDPKGDRLFVTGKYWTKLYEIKLTGAGAPGGADSSKPSLK